MTCDLEQHLNFHSNVPVQNLYDRQRSWRAYGLGRDSLVRSPSSCQWTALVDPYRRVRGLSRWLVLRFIRALAAVMVLVVVLSSQRADALNVHAIYRTACNRELGVMLKVDKRTVHLLKFDGTIIKIPRHEIVSLAYYPVSKLPLERTPSQPEVPALRVQTLYHDEIVNLAIGWPVDFSETKIAFLLENGKDLVIDKDSIWSLSFVRSFDSPKRYKASTPLAFAHPQTAGFCIEPKTQASSRTVFAQQLLNDRVVIKRELDRLHDGYQEVVEFEQDQKFYPVPHVYKDRTTLGLWVSALSRYGASKSRSNNFTPVLVDELHLGPFRYQHIFLSGAAPNSFLLHNEAQSQIFYRFKAAYFHASLFVDPNLVLVGAKYEWRLDDLSDEVLDDRVNEIAAVEFGFDFGPVAIELSPAVIAQSALKAPGLFVSKNDLNLWRAGIRFTKRRWEAEMFGGYATAEGGVFGETIDQQLEESNWRYFYGRANFSFDFHPRIESSVSAIFRMLDYQVSGTDFNNNNVELRYNSKSLSTALKASFALSHRFSIGGNAILEVQTQRFTNQSSKRRFFPKLGLSTSFSF